MHLIDTHAHIYLPEFDAARKELISAAAEKGVETILMPAIDSGTHAQMLQSEKDYNACRAMMGLHPCSVKENFKTELAVVQHWLEQQSFVAIGETGLDFYWDNSFAPQQFEALHQQIEWALKYSLPIVLHSRNATAECIEVVKQYTGLRGVFHCFSGTAQEAETIVELGFFLGIGGVLTFKNSGLDNAIKGIDLPHIILETDSPYLAPVPFRGKQNQPAHLRYVAERLAQLKGLEVAEVARLTTANACKLFQLPQQKA